MPEHIDLRPYLEAPCREISKYTTIFIADDNGLGSGTFVSACGFDGILTAHHVFNKVFEFKEFLLCVSDKPHQLIISRDLVECVPVGPVPENAKGDEGPDLAFLIIRETELLAKLREYKSFYSLDAADLSPFNCKLNPSLWGVAGTVEDSSKRLSEDYQGGPLTRLANLVAVGTFQSRSTKNHFDYVQIRTTVGEYGFPWNYGGVSGGGFWLIPAIEMRQGKPVFGAPILGGVEFHQSCRSNDERVLTGHGFDSIYSGVRKRLRDKLAIEKPGSHI